MLINSAQNHLRQYLVVAVPSTRLDSFDANRLFEISLFFSGAGQLFANESTLLCASYFLDLFCIFRSKGFRVELKFHTLYSLNTHS